MMPLYGFLQGDTLGLLILASEEESVRSLAEKLQTSAGVRVAPRAHVKVLLGGRVLEPGATLTDAGLTALDRFDVVAEEP